jgi:hypothetical protein
MDYETFAKNQTEQPHPLLKPASIFDQPARPYQQAEESSPWVIFLYLLAAAGLIAGGVVFALAQSSIHEIFAVLIALGGLLAMCVAVITGLLHRISLQLARIAQRGQG